MNREQVIERAARHGFSCRLDRHKAEARRIEIGEILDKLANLTESPDPRALELASDLIVELHFNAKQPPDVVSAEYDDLEDPRPIVVYRWLEDDMKMKIFENRINVQRGYAF